MSENMKMIKLEVPEDILEPLSKCLTALVRVKLNQFDLAIDSLLPDDINLSSKGSSELNKLILEDISRIAQIKSVDITNLPVEDQLMNEFRQKLSHYLKTVNGGGTFKPTINDCKAMSIGPVDV